MQMIIATKSNDFAYAKLLKNKDGANFDPRDRLRFKQTIQTKTTNIIKPYVDLVSNTLVISFFQPVFNRDNEIVGILSGDLPLEIFTKNIPEFKFSPSARVLIFENLFYVTPDRFMLDKKGKPFINALKEGM
ncbi:PDC sensor domain-containing protein [Campylobacter jejuni]|uniref:Chemotaxis protein n=1 Tax=Campylobacter jejuni TaxID=197 RepID=A0A690V315_CAMJU|nr:PDC sensor domain-containing protein [Campylobacter jejuni]EAJ5193043.1 hypothetical protein [Campylobacter jejuni]EAK0572978.1 hypothetical protein [Campylobacter jejuni]EDP7702501.1 hypothetical protein [Campylobacter jejuni]EDP8233587.1 hypothetical protein [Campylobacter jejuni]EFV4333945.1 hypothetical protein [Campylobacter jejuni]